MRSKKILVWTTVALSAVAIAGLTFLWIRHWRPHWSIVQGAVIRRDLDPRKQSPIAGVTVTASRGTTRLSAQSDASGYFRIAFPGSVLPGQTVELSFDHPDYQSLDMQVKIEFRSSLRRLVIASMAPNVPQIASESGQPMLVVSNIRIRYTVNSQNEENIGSAVRTFQVSNQGNTLCHRQRPCSPDGFWKAASGSLELDAGAGNEFRDIRASCIAGPCPFTQIDQNSLADGNQTIAVSALDWSDTATFLVEAEVFHTAIVSNARESYPVVFGRVMSFNLPGSAEGVSLEADLNGAQMVFPLGPDLNLSWATCSARKETDAGKSMAYRCELNPGYRF